MDYKNILEGTRPFFQGLPQPSLSVPPPGHVTAVATAASLPLATPTRDLSRDRAEITHQHSNHQQHYHHLLNQQQHPYQNQQHQSLHQQQGPGGHIPSNNTIINSSSHMNSNSNNITGNSHNTTTLANNNNNNRGSPTVINSSGGSRAGAGLGSGGGRSGSLDRLGHLHANHHRSNSPGHHHLNHSSSNNLNNNSNSVTTPLPLVLPQDGAALIRSKFEEGLGATLSQMYAGGQASAYSSTLNLTRSSNHLSSTPPGLVIPSGGGQTPNSLISDRDRKTTIIHSTTLKNKNSAPNSNSNSANKANNNSSSNVSMVGVVRRESPLDLSVKTVRQSADSSTSSLALEQPSSAGGGGINGTRSLSSSGASTPNMLSNINNNNNMMMSNSASSIGPSGNSARDSVGSVIAAVANSTTNVGRSRSREKSREKDQGSRTSTPTTRYPSPHHHRQQSPSSSSLHQVPPIHQRVANLNLSIPTPTPPPRTGSGSSAASAGGLSGIHNPSGNPQQQMQQHPSMQMQTQSNHHLLSHYPQSSPGGRLPQGHAVPQQQSAAAYLHHQHYAGIVSAANMASGASAGSQNPPSSTSAPSAMSHATSRSSSVIPPYNPPLGAGLGSYHTNHHTHHHPTASPYSHHHAAYPQYHPHFPAQTGQAPASGPPSVHPSYYPNYPHIQPPSAKPPTNSTSVAQNPSNVPAAPQAIPSPYATTQSKLSHPSYAPPQNQSHQQQQQTSQTPTGQAHQASSYYHPSSNYYGPPPAAAPQSQAQSNIRPGVVAPQQHPGYPSHHYGNLPPTSSTAATPYPHYSPISYPTYLPSNQRSVPLTNSSQPPSNYAPGQPASANFQSHPGLRPTTPTGPPPPMSSGTYAPGQGQYPSSNEKSAPNQLQQNNSQPPQHNSVGSSPMKPPETPVAVPQPRGPKQGSSRKNVLNMLRTSVETRIQEKQEKEKFQFNHQTWNFHGRKFNTSLPPLNTNTNSNTIGNGGPLVPGNHLGSSSSSLSGYGTGSSNSNTNSSGSATAAPNSFGRTGFSKYESSSLGGGSEVANPNGNSQQENNNSVITSGGSGSGGSMSAADFSNLHRIRTKAEKKQLFPNLLSQIEQENSHKEAEKMLQNSHIFSRQDLANNGNFNSTSVFDFKEDEDDFRPKILTIPQPPPPSINVPPPIKKPRSPKKLDGTRRSSLPKKGANLSPSINNKSEPLLNHLVDKNEDKSIPTISSGEILSSGSTIQAMKAVTKAADLDSKEDAFWATCDSFLLDLESNPNSIKSRRGGLWQKLKSKSKPNSNNPNATPGIGNASGHPVNKSRGIRIKKNSSEEDSDFEVDEKSEEEEEEEEDESGTDNSDDDSEANSKSGSSNIKLKSRKSKRRRVIQSDEENSGKSAEEDEDDEDDHEGTKSKSSEVTSAEGRKRGRKRVSSNITKGKAKADSSDEEVDTKKSPGKNKLARSGKRISTKSKKNSGRNKSQNRRRRSTRKRKTVIGNRPDISDLDDEDATSRTSIGSVESESEDSEASGSESFLNSGMDSDDTDRSTNSDESEDSDEDSDEDDQSMTSSGSRKRKKTGSGGSAKAKKAKRGKSGSGKRKTRKGGKWKKKSHGRSTRSKSSDVKNKLSGRRTRSKNEDEDYDDANFEPKSALLKSRSKGRKRRLPKRNCAPVPGNGKLKDISGESGDGEGGSSGEEWIMRGDLGKKKPRIVFGDGSDFRRPGWEEEVIDFKRKLRMPHKLIKVTKPSSMNMSPAISGTQSGASSLQEEKLGLTNHHGIPTSTSGGGATIPPTSGTSMPVPPTLTPAIPKDEPSPAKSAKENKIPQGAKGARQRLGEKTPEKVAKEKVAEASPILDKAKDTPSKKAKGRPPKNSNINSTPPVLTAEEPIGTVPVKNKKSKLVQPVDKASSNKKKGKSSTSKTLAFEKKSDTSESPLDEPTIEKAVERMKAAAASATKKERAALAAKCAATAADNNNLKVENGGDKIISNNTKKSVLQATGGKNNSNKKGSSNNNNNNSSKCSVAAIAATPTLIEDELPLLTPMEMNPPASVGVTPIPNSLTNSNPITPGGPVLTSTPILPVKKGFRRNKFKSGFDYIRKKKKVVTNPDGSPVPPQPKRIKTAIEKNSTVEDIQIEIRGWVLNKGHGETALHRAGRLGYADVAAYCLEYEICSPNCKDNAGYTPLHETCIKGNLEVAKILLAYGANHSQAAPGGIRPLHEACENGHVELVRLLISYGADPTTTTYGGQSPLELAEAHVAVRLLLDQHINDVNGVKEKSWEFRGSGFDEDPHEIGFDATADPAQPDPEPNEIDGLEFESSEIPLPPLYKLKEKSPFYVLLNDVLNYLGLPRDKFLINYPLTEMVELNSNDFLEEAHCCHLLGEKFNLNSSSDLLTLIKYDERIKKMLNIETCNIK